MNGKKKVRGCREGWVGYCPFSSFESRYSRLYHDTGQLGAHDHAQHALRHDRRGLRYGTRALRHARERARYNAQRTRQGVLCLIQKLYRDRGQRDTLRHGVVASTRRCARATLCIVWARHSAQYALHGLLRRDTIFLSRQGGPDTAPQRAHARGDTVGGAFNTAPRRHNTAPTAPQHGTQCAACALPRRSARTAWVPWVCALCTQPSFDSVHCLQSLFGSLFMDTIHGVLKIKIIKIKIKIK